MSKLLQATCVASVVTSKGVPVPAATILSEGIGASQGLLVLDENLAAYLTSNASDVKATLDRILDIISKQNTISTSISSALATIAISLTNTNAAIPLILPSPTVAAEVAAITANVASIAADLAQLALIQAQVTLLKGMLK